MRRLKQIKMDTLIPRDAMRHNDESDIILTIPQWPPTPELRNPPHPVQQVAPAAQHTSAALLLAEPLLP